MIFYNESTDTYLLFQMCIHPFKLTLNQCLTKKSMRLLYVVSALEFGAVRLKYAHCALYINVLSTEVVPSSRPRTRCAAPRDVAWPLLSQLRRALEFAFRCFFIYHHHQTVHTSQES